MVIRTKQEWRAATTDRPMETNPRPREAFIHHTENVTGGHPLSLEQQDAAMRGIQQFHMQTRGWSDIGYHYVVFPGGAAKVPRAYAARDVSHVPAAQLGHNTGTLAIAHYSGAGDFMEPHARYLIEQLIRLHPSVKTIGTHRQVTSTDCPGDNVAAAVRVMARALRLPLYAGGRGL